MGQDQTGETALNNLGSGDQNLDGLNKLLQGLGKGIDMVPPQPLEKCSLEEIVEYWRSKIKVGDRVLVMLDILYATGTIEEISETDYPHIFRMKTVRTDEKFCRSDIVPMKGLRFEELEEEEYPVITYLENIGRYFKAILKKGAEGNFMVFTPCREKGNPADPNKVFLNVSEYLLKKEEHYLEQISPKMPKNIVFEDDSENLKGHVKDCDDDEKSKEEERIIVGEQIKKMGLRHEQPVYTMHGSFSFYFHEGRLLIKKDEKDGKERYFVEHYDIIGSASRNEEPKLVERELEPKDIKCGVVYPIIPLKKDTKFRRGLKVIFDVNKPYKTIPLYSEGIIYEDFPDDSKCHCLSVIEGVETLVDKSRITLIPPDQLKKFSMTKKEVLQRNEFKKVLETFETEELILTKYAPYEEEDEKKENPQPIVNLGVNFQDLFMKRFRSRSWYSPKIKLYKTNPYCALLETCKRMECKFYDPYFVVEERYILCSKYAHNSLKYQKCCAKRAFLWWKRLCEFKNKEYEFGFFDEKLCEFNQGSSLGNCVFLSLFPFIDTMEKMQELVFPPHTNPYGFYVFKIWNNVNNEFNYLVIDDYIPLKGRYVMHCSSIRNTFFSLLEKATAKLWGSYANTSGEYATLFPDRAQVLSTLLFQCKSGSKEDRNRSISWNEILCKFVKDLSAVDGIEKERVVFETLQGYRKLGDLVTLTGGNGEKGIRKHHAYTLFSLHEFQILSTAAEGPEIINTKNLEKEDGEDDDEEEEREGEGEGEENDRNHKIGVPLRLVLVRNPHGGSFWNGDWSYRSEIWDRHPEVKKEVFSKVRNGWFFMCIGDLMKHFSSLNVYPSKVLEGVSVVGLKEIV